MSTVPNQIKIIVNRVRADKRRGYSITDLETETIAAQVLNAGAFKLWRYIVRNADQYSFGLSRKAAEEFGIKKDQYYKARDELIETGYLTQIGEGSNVYVFKERV